MFTRSSSYYGAESKPKQYICERYIKEKTPNIVICPAKTEMLKVPGI
jgi:hypothetical protein